MRGLDRTAGTLCLAAGTVHGVLGPAHFAEWWGYGLFFLVAALAQVLLGLALVLDAIEPGRAGARRALLAGGAAGNALLVALYVVTRTVGVPLVGPLAGEVERVGLLDLATKAAEIATVAILLVLLRRAPRAAPRPQP